LFIVRHWCSLDKRELFSNSILSSSAATAPIPVIRILKRPKDGEASQQDPFSMNGIRTTERTWTVSPPPPIDSEFDNIGVNLLVEENKDKKKKKLPPVYPTPVRDLFTGTGDPPRPFHFQTLRYFNVRLTVD
jgi:hypothetical protein